MTQPPDASSRRISPARIDFDGDTPRSPVYGDIYRPAGRDALEQARRVFVAGNGLPGRWHGRPRFTILETGFGLGHNLMALIEAWHADAPASRCHRLHVVSIDKHPVTLADLDRAWALAAPSLGRSPAMQRAVADLRTQWPPATPDIHRLGFADGCVTLDLMFADVHDALRDLVCVVDAIMLDGFAPARDEAMWSPQVFHALARLAADDATAATWSVARPAREGLKLAGFDVRRVDNNSNSSGSQGSRIGNKRQILTATRLALPPGRRRRDPLARLGAPVIAPAPAATPAFPSTGRTLPRPADVIVVGAGLAGAHVAAALAQRGVLSIVVDRHAEPAEGASGAEAGIFHGTVHRADTLHARLHRACALYAARHHQSILAPSHDALSDARSHGAVSGAVEGLLRLCDDSLEAMRARLDVQGLPADWVAPIDAATASRMSGAAIDRPCWYFPRAGWIGPRALSRLLLRRGGITFVGAAAVAKVERLGDDWVARAIDGAVVARGRACVLANAEQAAVLAPWARWPLQTSRGQSTCVDAGAPGLVAPCLPLGSNGYALTLPDGRVLCGASAHRGDPHALPRATDTLDNLDKLARLTGGRPAVDAASTLDRVAWRCRTPDRMPIVGAVPAIDPSAAWPGATRSRHVPREAGLYVLTALGSRGLTLAPLMGEVVAAAMLREPIPLPASLLDAIDPARFVAGARRGPPVESAVAA